MAENTNRYLVLLRETADPKPPVRLTEDGYSIRERGLRRIANPADLSALELALQLAGEHGGSVTAVCIGPQRLDDQARLALAMGASRAIRVWDSSLQNGDASADARLVGRVVDILKPELVLTGSRLLDRGDDPAPALAAARLGMPCIAAALSVRYRGSDIEVLRKSDRGASQRVAAEVPCTLLVEAQCSAPRYPTQEALMTALASRVEVWGLPELGLPVWELGEVGSALGKDRCSFPRQNPQRVVTPDASLPAFERILALLSGGIKPREGRVHALSAEETAEKLVEIFASQGLFDGSSS